MAASSGSPPVASSLSRTASPPLRTGLSPSDRSSLVEAARLSSGLFSGLFSAGLLDCFFFRLLLQASFFVVSSNFVDVNWSAA